MGSPYPALWEILANLFAYAFEVKPGVTHHHTGAIIFARPCSGSGGHPAPPARETLKIDIVIAELIKVEVIAEEHQIEV
jgi:hypothetical protein